MQDRILTEYHRFIGPHNPDERAQVRASLEVWGARGRHGEVAVRAYPGRKTTPHTGYSFGCEIPPKKNIGFRDKKPVVSFVYWRLGMPGVESRHDDDYACIKIDWMEE